MDLSRDVEHFQLLQIQKILRSSASVTTTGISCKPAFLAASHLLSPAIISYFASPELDFLTIIGCITPLSLIELDKSFKFSS